MSAYLNFACADEARAWLEGLRISFEDIDATVQDMLEPPRKRRLGPLLHRQNYRAARDQIRTALAYASPEPEHGDPSGSGSSPAL